MIVNEQELKKYRNNRTFSAINAIYLFGSSCINVNNINDMDDGADVNNIVVKRYRW